jgi:predicted RNase H-related nuclease YkuK (DUF458 family)
MELQFKRLSDNRKVDLISYVSEYLKQNPETEVYVGCDSQVHGRWTDFGMVIVLHKNKAGGHVLYATSRVERIRDKFIRLWTEVEHSINLAAHLSASSIPIKFVDVDLNPDPRWGSNTVLRSAMGYIEAMGFTPRCKPDAVSASYVADKICK